MANMIDFWAVTPVVGAAAGAAGAAALAAATQAGAAGAGAGMTKFSIDPDQAQKLITGLREARDRLQDLYEQSKEIQSLGAPAKDPYSGMATLAIRKAAGDEPGGYRKANFDARQALDKTIENIQAALDKYKQTDEAGQTAMNQGLNR